MLEPMVDFAPIQELWSPNSPALWTWETQLRAVLVRCEGVLVEWHAEHLGPPLRQEQGRPVWEIADPTYRICVAEFGVQFEFPRGWILDQCLDALEHYAESLGVFLNPIPRAERLEFERLGREAAIGVEYEIPRQPDEELRRFVLGYCDSQIYTDKDCPNPDLLGSIFMPLVFGALSPVDPERHADQPPDPAWERQKGLPLAGPEPEIPGPPPEPEPPPEPLRPDPPPEPELLQPDSNRIEEIRFKVSWDDLEKDAEAKYLQEVEDENARRLAAYEAAKADWDNDVEWDRLKVERDAQVAQLQKKHAKAVRRWKGAKKTAEAKHQGWCQQDARAQAARAAFLRQYLKDLGCVWEWYRAAGPRSINSQPMFFSCRMMHMEDWVRAVKAIRRELERRESFEL